jgi:flagellar hook protein FlgE
VLERFTVSDEGTITGLFSNGQSETLAQLSLALFVNPNGLSKVGQNVYTTTLSSGDPHLRTPGAGGAGSIRAGSLELSNVDVATELTNVLIMQRGYLASARLINAADSLVQEAISLSR